MLLSYTVICVYCDDITAGLLTIAQSSSSLLCCTPLQIAY